MTSGQPGRVVTVYHLDDMRSALTEARRAGQPVLLISAPDAAASLGAMIFSEMVDQAAREFPDVALDWLLDCGDQAGPALNALRLGVNRLIFTGDPRVREKLADMAGQTGGRVVAARPGDHDPSAD